MGKEIDGQRVETLAGGAGAEGADAQKLGRGLRDVRGMSADQRGTRNSVSLGPLLRGKRRKWRGDEMTKQSIAQLSRVAELTGWDDAHRLRRCSMTLSRWAELECGDGNEHGSWAIERDDEQGWRMDRKGCVEDQAHSPTGKPFMVHYQYRHGIGKDSTYYQPIADREKGALRRVAAICEAHGLHFYHQTDPRGAALYISREPLTDRDYSSLGVAVCK